MSSSNRPASPLVGEVIGQRFLIREHLDNTGQADVYRAEHVLTHKDVALKVSRAAPNTADEMVARFQRVARIATQLDHPNIIKIIDFGLDDRGYVFLALELGSGRDLARLLAEDGPLTPDEVAMVGQQILEGLGDAHRRGILHTELQPKFVMVDLASGVAQVKLLGFGLGQLMRSIERGEATLGPLGGEAACFAAPELLRGGGSADHRADLFAAGAILFAALTGQPPWPAGLTPLERADQGPPRASAVRTDGQVTMGLDRFLTQALDPDPARRFSDAAEMAAALRRAMLDDPSGTSVVEAVHLTFGRYKLLRPIAKGGMGELHLAVSETLPGIAKVCALKRLPPELAAEKSYVDRFLDEAKVVTRLAHAGVATVYDVGKVDDSFYMAMEYVVGKDCRRIIDRARDDGIPVPADVALFIARELADALAYAHRARLGSEDVGLIHRDVSPTNVMVTYEGQVKLIDFGLAKHATAAGKTETGIVMGKVAYMAPEQCLGEPVDQRADLYAVGAVLYELLTGKRLREVTDFERLAELVRQPLQVSIRRFRKDVPAELDLVFAKVLAVDPAGRYPQAEGLRDDLSQVLLDLNPRMSRDVVAAFLRSLFAAEAGSEIDRAQVLRTEPAPIRPETVLPMAGAGGMDRNRTAAMDIVDPASLGLATGTGSGSGSGAGATPGMAPTVVSFGADPSTKPVPPRPDSSARAAGASGGVAAGAVGAASPSEPPPLPGLSQPATSSAPLATLPPVTPPKRRGASVTLAVLLLVLGLAGGFAVRDLLLPDFLRPARKGRRAGQQSTVVPRPGAGQARPGPARPDPARPDPGRPDPARPDPARAGAAVPPEPRGPSLGELRAEVQAEMQKRLAQLAASYLREAGVTPQELLALADLEEVHDTTVAALGSGDLGKAVTALGTFRASLGEPRFACKKLRQAKLRWCKDRMKDLFRAAPKVRAERKAFLKTHRFDTLEQELAEAKKRARDESLGCVEQSLAYSMLIPALVKTLRAAGVPDEKWHPRRKGAPKDAKAGADPRGGEPAKGADGAKGGEPAKGADGARGGDRTKTGDGAKAGEPAKGADGAKGARRRRRPAEDE